VEVRTSAERTVADGRREVALLLVDMIRAFFDPRGEFYYPAAEQVLPGIRRLLAAARRGGRLVVHAHEVHRRTLIDLEGTKLPEHCLEGTLDVEFAPGFEPAKNEVDLVKRRYSAFFGTELALLLNEQGIRSITVAGVKTNVCIRATVQDAFANGFEPILVEGAVGSNRPHLHQASLEDVERYFGRLIALDEAESLLAGEDGAAE
jgi:maleamate amidohydrolase